MAYTVMSYIESRTPVRRQAMPSPSNVVMAFMAIAYTVMTYIIMAHIVMAFIGIAYTVMTYIVMAL